MDLIIYFYDGTEEQRLTEVDRFEFRTNHVSNWVKVKYKDGSEKIMHGICVLKTE